MPDPFHIDPAAIPVSLEYQWKRVALFGEADVAHAKAMRMGRWVPVPPVRHPEMQRSPCGTRIEAHGLVLMQKPKALVNRTRAEDRAKHYRILNSIWGGFGAIGATIHIRHGQKRLSNRPGPVRPEQFHIMRKSTP